MALKGGVKIQNDVKHFTKSGRGVRHSRVLGQCSDETVSLKQKKRKKNASVTLLSETL